MAMAAANAGVSLDEDVAPVRGKTVLPTQGVAGAATMAETAKSFDESESWELRHPVRGMQSSAAAARRNLS